MTFPRPCPSPCYRRQMIERARKILEHGFRRSAMVAYALNQSRAKVVMDPIYLAVARTLLRGHERPSEKLPAPSSPPTCSSRTARFAQAAVLRRRLGLRRRAARALTPRQRQMMHTVALGETSGAAVADGFLRAFRTHPELAAFFGAWFTEELNHFFGYHLYLGRWARPGRPSAASRSPRRSSSPTPPTRWRWRPATCTRSCSASSCIARSPSRSRIRSCRSMLAQFAKDECATSASTRTSSPATCSATRVPAGRAQDLPQGDLAVQPDLGRHHQRARSPVDGRLLLPQARVRLLPRPERVPVRHRPGAFWTWYFRGVVPPSARAARRPSRVPASNYEDGAPAPVKNPGWWQAVLRGRERGGRGSRSRWRTGPRRSCTERGSRREAPARRPGLSSLAGRARWRKERLAATPAVAG